MATPPEKDEQDKFHYETNKVPLWVFLMWATFLVAAVIYLGTFAAKDFVRWW